MMTNQLRKDPCSTIMALQRVLSFAGVHHTVSPVRHKRRNELRPLSTRSSLQLWTAISSFIMKYNPLRWLVTQVCPLGAFPRENLCRTRGNCNKKNVGYSHRLRLSLVRLVWTTACSLDHSVELNTVSRPETLIPSTPKPSQYSAAA